MTLPLIERFRGALLGLACGDAVGTTVEFKPRGSFAPVTGMTGGGPFALQPGEWTDDTSMALCLAASLVHCGGFDPVDQMNRYCNWREVGYMSSNGRCFDIGITVAQALDRYLASGDPFAGDVDPRTAGNGALMRLAPIVLFFAGSATDVLRYSGESTRTTHATQEAIECSRLFGLQLQRALAGASKAEIFSTRVPEALSAKVDAIARGAFLGKKADQIRGTGYCVDSLEAALWCFATTDSFEAAILQAANLGDDADTTAAICGQMAGAFYGVNGIPAGWRAALVMREDIETVADQLFDLRAQPQSNR